MRAMRAGGPMGSASLASRQLSGHGSALPVGAVPLTGAPPMSGDRLVRRSALVWRGACRDLARCRAGVSATTRKITGLVAADA
jgi:hypothetical protein